MSRKSYKPRLRTLTVVREELDTARHALARLDVSADPLERRIIASAVRDLESEAATLTSVASQIVITWDTDADVLILEAA